MIKRKKIFLIIFFLLLLGGFFWSSGKLLDMEAERLVQQLYVRDDQGVIQGLQSVAIVEGHDQALILIHGFLQSPAIFSELIADLKPKLKMDIYAPLLPFHGRDLKAAAVMDADLIIQSITNYLDTLAKKYRTITVVGISFGGAIVTEIARQGKLPANVYLILAPPAIYITSNTPFSRLTTHLFGLWRNYCNYPSLGCNFPTYESGDASARKDLEEEKTVRYKIITSIFQLYQLDDLNQNSIQTLQRPFSLIAAEDDNRIFYDKQKAACESNIYCHFYSFPSGKHLLFWSAYKKQFADLIIKLATHPPENVRQRN